MRRKEQGKSFGGKPECREKMNGGEERCEREEMRGAAVPEPFCCQGQMVEVVGTMAIAAPSC